MADRIVVLNAGRIEQVGTPLELYHQPQTRFVAGFLGAPAMNFLPVTVDGATLHLPGGGRLTLKAPRQGAAEMGVRPERIRLAAAGEAVSLRGSVSVIEPLGADTLVTVLCAGHKVVLRQPGDSPLRPADDVQLVLDADNVILFDATTGRR